MHGHARVHDSRCGRWFVGFSWWATNGYLSESFGSQVAGSHCPPFTWRISRACSSSRVSFCRSRPRYSHFKSFLRSLGQSSRLASMSSYYIYIYIYLLLLLFLNFFPTLSSDFNFFFSLRIERCNLFETNARVLTSHFFFFFFFFFLFL